MGRPILIASGAVLVLAGALLVGVTIDAVYQAREAQGREAVLFTVHNGEPFSRIIDRLAEAGFVAHPRLVTVYAALFHYDRQAKAGTYRLTPEQSPRDIIGTFVSGEVYKISVTIPEGYMYTQIAGALAASVGTDSTAFVLAANDPELRGELSIDAPSLEGYLFPDTYSIPWGMEPSDIARIMVERMTVVFDDTLQRRAAELGMTRRETLTFASIVEAETRLPEELPLVSAVYHNRLRKGMRLEADPTVAYAMGGYKGRLYYKDLEIDSPYNTYRNQGLPPGPICSPGRAAIEAALNPDPSCRALYFVAREDGGHVFSLTLQDHLAAIRKIRGARGRNQQ